MLKILIMYFAALLGFTGVDSFWEMDPARSYPLYKQCDPKWGNDQLGTSSNTICRAGCLMSSVAMALSGCGISYNPQSLNHWLKGHGGYVNGDLFVWASVNSLGLTYKGKIHNS